MQELILVDELDNAVGSMEKMEAHVAGALHRAYSVFIFNFDGKMLLQQRALAKYHSGGLWTNACCSHPYLGQEMQQAAAQRLFDEMGFTCDIEKIFEFTYKATFDNGLIEHEYDHVFIGYYDDVITPNKDEVENFTFATLAEITEGIAANPEIYTAWFKIAFPLVVQHLEKAVANEKK